ncbi:MAG: ribonuclease catalytic domain-containing protein [Planctomycetota bacterium]
MVLYKNRPARVGAAGEKLELELADGKTQSVRPKDVTLLHPGPLRSLRDLHEVEGDVESAWELLAGESTSFIELVELIHGDYSPSTAWATYRLIQDGLLFKGSVEEVRACPRDEVDRVRTARAQREHEREAWTRFAERVAAGTHAPIEDARYLAEIERVARGQLAKSPVLAQLGVSEEPAAAHGLLLTLGYWPPEGHPYPERAGLARTSPDIALAELVPEPRLDLTHLASFAIDDEGSTDPDDAISIDGNRLWVHIADVAALIPPDSPADVEARARGANLYLPEGVIPMLPEAATTRLALGLSRPSPALSVGLDLDGDNRVMGIEIRPSWTHVTRLSYEEAERRASEEPFARLIRIGRAASARREQQGAVSITLPEVKIRVIDGQVVIKPLADLESRRMVQECMLLAGEAVARFAVEHAIPFPFTTQSPPEANGANEGAASASLAAAFARRMTMKPAQVRSVPGPHSGLGLELYSRVTSPLRRYLDLVAHQQLRAFLAGRTPLSEAELLARVGAAEAVGSQVRRTERLVNRHWTLVHLLRHPEWIGESVVVEQRGNATVLLVPEFATEFRAYGRGDLALDQTVPISILGLRLPDLDATVRVERRLPQPSADAAG